MIPTPVWSRENLDRERQRSEEHFRDHRDTEPLEVYLNLFDEYQGIVEEVMEETVDLTELDGRAFSLLSDSQKREVFRYLAGPPVSEDDLKVLMKCSSFTPMAFEKDPELLSRVVAFMRDWHDRRRFPWLNGGWDPREHERNAAILATSALLAMRRVETRRRTESGGTQEGRVEQQLIRTGLHKVPTRHINTLAGAPQCGEFCRETRLGTRKADFVIGLWDGRAMGLECKVSNSATNSVKRLNNDAAVKAEVWRKDFGVTQVVPAAILSGVYALRNLEEAQERGLALFWAHDLHALVDWIHQTKSE